MGILEKCTATSGRPQRKLPPPDEAASARRPVCSRALASLLAVLALQSGCAAIPPATTAHQTMPGKVAVVAASQESAIDLGGYTRGKGEGAARNLLSPSGRLPLDVCLGIVVIGAAFVVLAGGITSGIAAMGLCVGVSAALGAEEAPSAEEVGGAEGQIFAALDTQSLQESLRKRVLAAASANGTPLAAVPSEIAQDAARLGDYRPLAAAGADTVLEVALSKVGIGYKVVSRINPPLQLHMEVRVRLIGTRDNAELFAADYVYRGESLKLSEWSADQAERLLRAVKTGYETLASHIHDNVFLLYPFPDREPHGEILIPVFGLAPIYPPKPYVTVVDDLQPTLRWESFPRPSDLPIAPEDMARVKDVRYDLVIAPERDHAPAETVYRREGLPASVHSIEAPLDPGTRYRWTVRARFELDGRQRVTEWASKVDVVTACQWSTVPSGCSYQFRTP